MILMPPIESLFNGFLNSGLIILEDMNDLFYNGQFDKPHDSERRALIFNYQSVERPSNNFDLQLVPPLSFQHIDEAENHWLLIL